MINLKNIPRSVWENRNIISNKNVASTVWTFLFWHLFFAEWRLINCCPMIFCQLTDQCSSKWPIRSQQLINPDRELLQHYSRTPEVLAPNFGNHWSNSHHCSANTGTDVYNQCIVSQETEIHTSEVNDECLVLHTSGHILGQREKKEAIRQLGQSGRKDVWFRENYESLCETRQHIQEWINSLSFALFSHLEKSLNSSCSAESF